MQMSINNNKYSSTKSWRDLFSIFCVFVCVFTFLMFFYSILLFYTNSWRPSVFYFCTFCAFYVFYIFCIFYIFLHFFCIFCVLVLLYFVIWLDSPYELPCKIWSLQLKKWLSYEYFCTFVLCSEMASGSQDLLPCKISGFQLKN